MFARLAFRNVRRQIGNYLIYFITVSLTVALMFAVDNVIFSPQLMEFARRFSELKSGLIAITVLIALTVAFVLGYATGFLLRLRRREFGMYLTLGMTRKNVLRLFVLEMLIMGSLALVAGIFLGLFVYQGLMAMLTRLLQIDLSFADYTVQGFLLTVGLVAGAFALSSLSSAVYLKRASVRRLLSGEQVVEKNVKHPAAWLGVAAGSLAAIVWTCFAFYRTAERAAVESAGGMEIFWQLAALAVLIIVFHVAFARSAVGLLLRSRRICSAGANVFTLRQLSCRLGTSSVMAGILAFLIAFAVVGMNVSFVQRISEQAALDRQYPFDITVGRSREIDSPISMEEGERIIAGYAKIRSKTEYRIYTTGNGYLTSFTPWSGEQYEGLEDYVMTESDANRLLAAKGMAPVSLNGGFMVLAGTPQVRFCDFSEAGLTLGGTTYRYAGTMEQFPLNFFAYFVTVVPDEAVRGLRPEITGAAYDLASSGYDAGALADALSYPHLTQDGRYTYQRCDYQLKEEARNERNGSTAVLTISVLYVAAVFLFLALAILALKTLAGVSGDRRRYEILSRLGADRKERCRSLFRQTFGFFALPFFLPMLLSIPCAAVCAQVMRIAGYTEQLGGINRVAAAVAAAIAMIYLLYFTATYLLAKRTVIRTDV